MNPSRPRDKKRGALTIALLCLGWLAFAATSPLHHPSHAVSAVHDATFQAGVTRFIVNLGLDGFLVDERSESSIYAFEGFVRDDRGSWAEEVALTIVDPRGVSAEVEPPSFDSEGVPQWMNFEHGERVEITELCPPEPPCSVRYELEVMSEEPFDGVIELRATTQGRSLHFDLSERWMSLTIEDSP